MLSNLDLQRRARLKFKRFQVACNSQCGEHGVSVDVAALGNEMPNLLKIGEQADHNNVLSLGSMIATLRKCVQAPLRASNTPLNPVAGLRLRFSLPCWPKHERPRSPAPPVVQREVPTLHDQQSARRDGNRCVESDAWLSAHERLASQPPLIRNIDRELLQAGAGRGVRRRF